MPFPIWLFAVVQLLTLLGQVAMLVMAVWLYRQRQTSSFVLLKWVCICFVVWQCTPFVFGLASNAFLASHNTLASLRLSEWRQWTATSFGVLFVALMITTLLSFLREHDSSIKQDI
jgi:hypothetical protein